MKTRLIVDMSSLCWTNLLKGKDTEHGVTVDHNGKPVLVNSAGYGYEHAMTFLTNVMDNLNITPYDVVLVVEGQGSKSRREAVYPGYKGGRDSRPPEAYQAFNTAKFMIVDAMKSVGATWVMQDAVEADDVIAYLCKGLAGRKIILSNDDDLAVLINEDVSLYRMGSFITDRDPNPQGPFSFKYTTLRKALVGGHDNLKGAVGFGEKAWDALVEWVPNESVLGALEGMVKRKTLHDLKDDVEAFKPFQKIIDSADLVYKAYAVALLHPEWVNPLRQPLQIHAGMTARLDQVQDERLRRWAQKVRLVTADTYDKAVEFLRAHLDETPEFALDIESSTPEESDEWLAAGDRDDKVDVFGQELVSCAITFGANGQFTFYFSVRHADTNNVTSEQLRQVVAMIPREKVILVQNAGFELSVLYKEWGEKQADNGWHGFLPNVRDTKVYASYVDENMRLGLKDRSKHHLGYDQITYDEVTTLTGHQDSLPRGGKLLDREVIGVEVVDVLDEGTGHTIQVEQPVYSGVVTKRYKMHELSGQHVLAYGADDTICTYALAQYYRLIMELEKTWDLCQEIETYPAYLTALGFLQGTKFDLGQMLEQEAEDDAVWERSWYVLRQFLMDNNWEGTVCPEIVDEPKLHYHRKWEPKTIKEAVTIILQGVELVTQVRTPAKLGKLIAALEHEDAELLGKYVEDGNINQINDWMKTRFEGEPRIDLDSPKAMRGFLYDFLKLPIRLVNKLTTNERINKPELTNAVTRFTKLRSGSGSEPPLRPEELEVLKAKAKTDDTAIDFALTFDVPGHPALLAIKEMKTIETRRKMFYRPYRHFRHWYDNLIHASANQCQAVTRRWSFSDPNLTQLPKRGEGVKFRRNFKPHHKDAVVVSVDFNSQELRLQAGLSRDPEMLTCYIGDRLRDIHSITASGAMKVVWKADELAKAVATVGDNFDTDYDLFIAMLKGGDAALAKKAKDLRALSKNVNFGSAYGCAAPKMQELLVCDFEIAKTMLEAKLALFSRYEEWKKEVEDEALSQGYVRTLLGGIRHLQGVIRSDDKAAINAAARQASNFKIQSAGAELAKKALTKLWKSGVFFKLDAVFFAVIHDEVVASVHKDHAVEFIKVLHDAISQPYTPDFPVPFIGSISLGPNLGDQVELGDTVDEALIQETINQMFSTVEINGTPRRFVDWTESMRLDYNKVISLVTKGKSLEQQVLELV